MAVGTRTTYTDTTPQVRNISDIIRMLDWNTAGLLNKFGLNAESKFRLVNGLHTKIEWLEDTMSGRSTTLNESGYDDSETDMTVTDSTIFKEGDILLIDSELQYISAVNTSTHVLTTVRGFGGTTAASHSNGATVQKATIARLEGADYTTGHTTTVTNPFNYTQILSEAIKVTGSEMVNTKYGISDTMAYHLAKLIGGGGGGISVNGRFRAGTLPILLQQTFYHGKRAAGSATAARAMGGFTQYVTTNVSNPAGGSGAPVTRKDIEDMFEDIFLAGGMPDTLITNSWGVRKISSFYEGSIYTDRSETRGGSRITTIVTDFGEIEVMFDWLCPTDKMYFVDSTKLGWTTYRPFQVIDRPVTGDYVAKEVLGEFSFILVNEKAHGYLQNISTTA